MEPVGFVRARGRYRYDAPRQGVLAGDNGDRIVLEPGRGFEQALRGLDGFGRIWVLWAFHLNEGWKPVTHPPRAPAGGVGVFACRAPYRPNPLGLSAVRLLAVSGRELLIGESDMLDGTPVFDIKPYVPYADAFPDAAAGWLDTVAEQSWEIMFTPGAVARVAWVGDRAGLPLRAFIEHQLEHDPLDGRRRRIARSAGDRWTLAYRTWRVDLDVDEARRKITVVGIRSGYAADDLAPGAPDRWQDKDAHREFRLTFGEEAD